MKKHIECDRCGVDIPENEIIIVHDCVDKEGKHFDYCEDCWSENTMDTDETDNLIIK